MFICNAFLTFVIKILVNGLVNILKTFYYFVPIIFKLYQLFLSKHLKKNQNVYWEWTSVLVFSSDGQIVNNFHLKDKIEGSISFSPAKSLGDGVSTTCQLPAVSVAGYLTTLFYLLCSSSWLLLFTS